MLARSKLKSIESKISEALMNNQKQAEYKQASGILSSVGIRTPLNKIPVLGDIFFKNCKNSV